jgi:hypothetical protein
MVVQERNIRVLLLKGLKKTKWELLPPQNIQQIRMYQFEINKPIFEPLNEIPLLIIFLY